VSNNGVLTVYSARTGERAYQQRLGDKGGHSASVVAADGKVYFTSEDGDVNRDQSREQV
jgi:outer membrane protein assembly factor BamB